MLLKTITSIDIYITYRCDLRCNHCFLGPKLDNKTNFDLGLLQKLIKTAPSWNTKEITFLGGEPSLYPYLSQSVKLVQNCGIQARIVTNGQRAFYKFLHTFDGNKLPRICFSIDGSNEEVHDNMRGKGSFERLLSSISIANEKGYLTSGIISINRENANDCEHLLDFCNSLGFEYVNVHYVTNRGFATEESVLSIDEWLSIVHKLESKSKNIKLDVRVERTFTPQTGFSGGCAVREESNLMFFPDGRVFMCAMFIDMESTHSFVWSEHGLTLSQSKFTEKIICGKKTPTHCPAIALINPSIDSQALTKGYVVKCIYDKSCLRNGNEIADSRSSHLPN